jgi:hypothetical protein
MPMPVPETGPETVPDPAVPLPMPVPETVPETVPDPAVPLPMPVPETVPAPPPPCMFSRNSTLTLNPDPER